MRRVFRYSLLVVSLCMFALPLRAEWVPLIRSFTPNDYKASTQNWRMVEQHNGWMYAANNYGVLEFDGMQWKLYGIGNSTVVRSVAKDDEGRIYAGGTNDFGFFTSNSQGGMDYHSLVDSLPEQYRNFGEVWQIFPSEQCLYVQTRSYVFLFPAVGKVQVIDPADVIRTSLLMNGEFYMATSRDLFVLTGNRLHPLRGTYLFNGATVCALVPWDSHSLLIATDFAGLFIYDGNHMRPFHTQADRYIRENQLYTVAVRDDCLALGTVRKGVVLVDREGNSPRYFTREEGMQNNTVLSLLFDRYANLWVGLDQGIDCIQLALPITRLNDKQVDFGSGYSACSYKDDLYLGTNQGLYLYKRNSPTSADNPSLVPGSLGQVWDIREVDGRLFCSHNRGLFELQNGVMKPIYTGDGVWSVRPFADNRIIAGTYNGFLLLNGQTATLLAGFHETALYYEVDAANNIWMLSSRGVEKLTVDPENASVSSETVVSYPAAQQHFSLSRVGDSIYLANKDYFCIVDKDGRLSQIDPREVGLPDTAQYRAIRRSQTGKLIYFRPEDMSSFLIGGFVNMTFDNEGNIIVGGVSGFRKLSMSSNLPKDVERKLYFRRLRTTSPNVETVYGEGSQYRMTDGESPITLPSNVYSLKAEFSGNEPLLDNARFATRLWPVEQEFSEFSEASERNLTALRAGTYRLDVQMLTYDGITERSLFITVKRPWYASWYAILAYCLFTLAFILYIAFSIRHRVRMSRQRLLDEKNSELQEQRVRILQLENDKAQFSLRQKSQELSTMLLSETTRKELTNDILLDVRRCIDALNTNKLADVRSRLIALQNRLTKHADANVDWQRFEDNYDLVNDQFLQKLKQMYPWMSKQERRLAVYIRMGLTSKEIAPLMNLTPRGVDMMRYRLREKMSLPPHTNLKQFFNEIA